METNSVYILILAIVASSASGQTYTVDTVAGGGLPDTPVAATAVPVRPLGIAVDAGGNVYFSSGNAVFKVDSTGILMRVAGAPGGGPLGDGGAATSAHLIVPEGAAVDSVGSVYIADSLNNRIRKVAPDGTISTVAGNGTAGYSGDGGLATRAQVNYPNSVAVDSAGNLYIADTNNQRIRKVALDGTISTVAGSGTRGYSGDGGPGTSAQLDSPFQVAPDSAGNLYIADFGNRRIRKVAPDGAISTVAGNGTAGYSGDGGPATLAQLYDPSSVAMDSGGNLYIADSGNNRIRKMAPDGTISTVAGSGTRGYSGDGGPATRAQLYYPLGVAVDSAGNLYVADGLNWRIRKVAPDGTILTAAGSGAWGYFGDGGPAISAQLYQPRGVAVDSSGNLYIADSLNHRIRKVAPDGTILTAAGSGTWGYLGDGGPATSAWLWNPSGVVVDSAGNLYIADRSNNCIRKVAPGGTISTVAGIGTQGYSGDGGPATRAQLYGPSGVAVDSARNLYITDTSNHRIRKVTPDGTISTVAGTGTRGYSGDGGPGTSAQLYGPSGVAVGSAGNLHIADTSNHRIRKVAPQGVISTVAGTGLRGYSGDGGPGTSAQLDYPRGVAVDSAGNLYITDTSNHRIRKVTPDGTISTVAGTGLRGYSGDGGPATRAELNGPSGAAVDSAGKVYVADEYNNSVRVLTPADSTCTYTAAPTSLQPPGSGGNFTIRIQTSASCSWTITGLPAWITVSGAASGIGSSSVTLVVAANTGAARSAAISIAGQTVSVYQAPGGTAPAISVQGVVNAASGLAGPLAPGQFVSIYGAGLGPVQPVTSKSMEKGLGYTRVFFNGIEAFLTYTSAGQVNALAPYGIAGSDRAELQVEYQAMKSSAIFLPVTEAAPGIFTQQYGTGQAWAVNQDQTFNSDKNPAERGSYVAFWATGQGLVNPAGQDGENIVAPNFPRPRLPVNVTIGGVQAEIAFAGLIYAGVVQVNARVPGTVTPGKAVELLLVVGNSTSRRGVTLAVR